MSKERPTREDFEHPYPNVGYKLKEYSIALEKWAKDAEHYISTTEGLWATDRPDLIDDPNKVLYELKP